MVCAKRERVVESVVKFEGTGHDPARPDPARPDPTMLFSVDPIHLLSKTLETTDRRYQINGFQCRIEAGQEWTESTKLTEMYGPMHIWGRLFLTCIDIIS